MCDQLWRGCWTFLAIWLHQCNTAVFSKNVKIFETCMTLAVTFHFANKILACFPLVTCLKSYIRAIYIYMFACTQVRSIMCKDTCYVQEQTHGCRWTQERKKIQRVMSFVQQHQPSMVSLTINHPPSLGAPTLGSASTHNQPTQTPSITWWVETIYSISYGCED